MLTKPEADRIAAAVNVLRPDWSTNGIVTLLADERIRFKRDYRDACLAMVAVAIDPESKRPTRILEHGPWWEATRPAVVNTSDTLGIPDLDHEHDCHRCGKPFEHLHHGGTGTEEDHSYEPPPPADHHAHASQARAALNATEDE